MTLEGGQAVFWHRGEMPAKQTEAGEKVIKPTTERAIRISEMAFDTMRERAPGWDKYMLENMYVEWAKTKDAARREDARFLRWVTSYTKGKAAP